MGICFKCEKEYDEANLLRVIYNDEIVKMCEFCANEEEVPIINKPSLSQLKETERNYTVYERLSRMAGLPLKKEDKKKEVSFADLQKKWIEKKKIEEQEKKAREKSKKANLNLIDNFHWAIMMARRKKGLSQKQLASALAEQEATIKMIENNEMPENTENLIKKLEQFLGIELKKHDMFWEEKPAYKEIKPSHVEKASEIIIQKEENKTEKQITKEETNKQDRQDVREKIERKDEGFKARINEQRALSFDREVVKNITIDDLRRIKQEREKLKQAEELERQRAESKTSERLKKEINVSEIIWKARRDDKIIDKKPEEESEEIKEKSEEEFLGSVEFEE